MAWFSIGCEGRTEGGGDTVLGRGPFRWEGTAPHLCCPPGPDQDSSQRQGGSRQASLPVASPLLSVQHPLPRKREGSLEWSTQLPEQLAWSGVGGGCRGHRASSPWELLRV